MFLVLGLLAVAIALARLHTFHEPLERDLTTYALIAQGLREGRSLYAEMWDHKPPAIYWVNAAAQSVAGAGPASIYLLGVGAAVLTLLGVHAAGSGAGRGARVGLVAAACWAVVSGDVWLQANQPNTEVFINACIAALLALLLRAPEPVGALRAAACGVAIGVAALFKPVALAYGLLPLLAVWRGGGGRLPALAALAGGLGGVALLAVAPFALAGTLDALVDVVWTYNRHYAENPLVNVVRGLEPMRLFHPSLRDVVPLLTVALLAPLAALPAAPSRGALVLAAWALATAVAVAAPGRSFPHYYQLWLPGLCVAAAWGLDALDRGRGGAAPWVRVLALLGVLVYLQAPAYTWPAERWSRVKYGDVFVDAQRLGRWADSVLAPDARLYNWGKESGLYWSSGRRPPSGVLLPSYHTVNWPGADALAARVVRELERAPPELVVLSDALPPDHAVARWLRAHYALSPDAPDVPGFRVLRRAPP